MQGAVLGDCKVEPGEGDYHGRLWVCLLTHKIGYLWAMKEQVRATICNFRISKEVDAGRRARVPEPKPRCVMRDVRVRNQ